MDKLKPFILLLFILVKPLDLPGQIVVLNIQVRISEQRLSVLQAPPSLISHYNLQDIGFYDVLKCPSLHQPL